MKALNVLKTVRWLVFPVVLTAALCGFWVFANAAHQLVTSYGANAESQLHEAGLYDSLQAAARRYGIQRNARTGVYETANEAPGWRAEFTADGLRLLGSKQMRLDPPDWTWLDDKKLPAITYEPIWQAALRFDAYGYGDTLTTLKGDSVTLEGPRATIHKSAIEERYDNRPAGLRQSFLLPAPPANATAGLPLRLALTLDGDLSASAEADGKAINLTDQHGLLVLRYAKLQAKDAQGRDLPTRLRAENQQINLEIEDGGAAFPLMLDLVFTQVKRLTALPDSPARRFGASIAVDGDTAVVGAPLENAGVDIARGAAYIFVLKAGQWQRAARLEPSDGNAFATFGAAVAIKGDTIAVGAPGLTGPSGAAQGAVYVFVRNGATWTQQAKLTGRDDNSPTQLFGGSVALANETLAVGATGESNGQGAGYIFARARATWREQAKFNGAGNFGKSAALQNDTAMFGADAANQGRGAATVFTREGSGAWSQRAVLTANDAAPQARFGYALAYDGNNLLIGAPQDPQGNSPGHGAAYIFTGGGASWSQQTKLVANDGQTDDGFGSAVALSGIFALIGAPFADVQQFGSSRRDQDAGAYYPFFRGANGWRQLRFRHTNSPSAAGDHLGAALALQNSGAILSGAPMNSYGDLPGHGAVYTTPFVSGEFVNFSTIFPGAGEQDRFFGERLAMSGNTLIVTGLADVNSPLPPAFVFVREANGWRLQAKLKPSDGVIGDAFGTSVALQGDTAVIGASRVNGIRGAAYVFVRNGETWSEQAKLTAPDSNRLGFSLALSGDTLCAGAPFDNQSLAAGAAYIFTRANGVWTQQARLAPVDGRAGDEFGANVALDGNTALITRRLVDPQMSSGAAYIFVREGVTWSQQARFAPLAETNGFGRAAALSGDTAIVTAPARAYVFARNGAAWAEQSILTASDGAANLDFGASVALEGDTALVGAPSNLFGPLAGAAYLYRRAGAIWTQEARFSNNNTRPFARFGNRVAYHQGTAIIAAPQEEVEPLMGILGAAYVFQTQPLDNNPPTIREYGAEIIRAGSGPQTIPLALVADANQSPRSLAVTISPTAANGLTIANIQVDETGIARAQVTASCAAPVSPTTFTLTVTDSAGAAATLRRTIAVQPNAPPALAYPPANLVNFNDPIFVSPIYGLSDNWQVASVSVQSVTPVFAGEIQIFPESFPLRGGAVITARSAGAYTAIIRATDNCGLFTDVPLNFTVGSAPATITLLSSPNPSFAGQTATFTATVAPRPPASGIPDGFVTFTIDGVAQAPVSLVNGQAEFFTAQLTPGLHSIIAAYNGSATFLPGSDSLFHSVIIPIPTAWTATGSTGAVNEEDFAIMEMDGPRLSVRATGVVHARYNVVAVEDANFEGADNRHLINIRFRDTDGPGAAARVQLTLYRHEIDFGGGPTALFTFDSNQFLATGNRDLTVQLNDCAAGLNFDLDFRRYVYWVEAVVTRNDATQQAGFSGMQLTETETPCP